MVGQRFPGGGGMHAPCMPVEQAHAGFVLHLPQALAGSGQRKMRAGGTGGDAAGIDHVHEQAQVGEIQMHEDSAGPKAWERFPYCAAGAAGVESPAC